MIGNNDVMWIATLQLPQCLDQEEEQQEILLFIAVVIKTNHT